MEKNQLFGFLCGNPELKAKKMGFAFPPSRTDQNGPSGMSATRENLLQSGAHSVKSIVLSPCNGSSLNFPQSPFSPLAFCFLQNFLLRYGKVDSNECYDSSLRSDSCHANGLAP